MDISDVLADFSFSDSTEESDSISLTLNDREEKWFRRLDAGKLEIRSGQGLF